MILFGRKTSWSDLSIEEQTNKYRELFQYQYLKYERYNTEIAMQDQQKQVYIRNIP